MPAAPGGVTKGPSEVIRDAAGTVDEAALARGLGPVTPVSEIQFSDAEARGPGSNPAPGSSSGTARGLGPLRIEPLRVEPLGVPEPVAPRVTGAVPEDAAPDGAASDGAASDGDLVAAREAEDGDAAASQQAGGEQDDASSSEDARAAESGDPDPTAGLQADAVEASADRTASGDDIEEDGDRELDTEIDTEVDAEDESDAEASAASDADADAENDADEPESDSPNLASAGGDFSPDASFDDEDAEAPPLTDAGEIARVCFALLLTQRDGVAPSRLAEACGSTQKAVREALEELQTILDRNGLPLEVSTTGDRVRLMSRPEVFPYVQRLKGLKRAERLSPAALETLAVIAYRQPAIRAEIESIRGVKAGPMLRSLLEHKLVKVVGRADVPGRPLQYGTTQAFLERFGLASLKELPSIQEFKSLG